MAKSFSAAVSKFVRESKEITEAVFKSAVQDVAIDANTPTAQGGRMRVDTGFLRNSQIADLNKIPSRPEGPSRGDSEQDVALVILNATVNDVIWVGWTAKYARPRENKDGFLEAAAQKWPKRVRDRAAEAKRRSGR